MKDNARAAFMLYKDNHVLFDEQTDENAGKLIKAIFAYIRDGEELESADGMLNMAFKVIKSVLDRDMEKYEKTCARNAENQRKRWDRQHTNLSVDDTDTAEDTNVYERIPSNMGNCISIDLYTNRTDKDNDNKNDNNNDIKTKPKNDTDTDASRELRFVPTSDPYSPREIALVCNREKIPLNVYGVTAFIKAMRATNWQLSGRPIENLPAVLNMYSQQAPELYTRDLSQSVAYN